MAICPGGCEMGPCPKHAMKRFRIIMTDGPCGYLLQAPRVILRQLDAGCIHVTSLAPWPYVPYSVP